MAPKIAASILTADFGKLKEQIEEAAKHQLDIVHFDVMDGNFVPNITFGASLISSLRKYFTIPFDIHLMIQNPQQYLDDFLNVEANFLSFHWEAILENKISKTTQLLRKIRNHSVLAGIAISPQTSPKELEPILEELDFIVIMTVNPGFGGQPILPACLEKISFLKELIQKKNLPIQLEVDGGIKKNNISLAIEKGADILVAGSAIFHQKYSIQEGMDSLKKLTRVKEKY